MYIVLRWDQDRQELVPAKEEGTGKTLSYPTWVDAMDKAQELTALLGPHVAPYSVAYISPRKRRKRGN